MEFSGIRDKGMADVADRREDDVKQRIEELLDRAHLKSEFSVDYKYMEVGKARFTINDGCYPAEPVR